MDDDALAAQLSPPVLYRRFKPLFRPRPALYWADMLASALVGWGATALFLVTPSASLLGVAALAVAVLGLYRAVLFIHELCHLKHGAIYGFDAGWNLVVGIPLLVPSLMYVTTHADHHRRAQFATEEDPEYDPIAYWEPFRIWLSFAMMLLVPLLLIARWGLLGPLSYLSLPLRRRVVEKASSLVINPTYRRRQLTHEEVAQWAWQEGLGALWIWGLAAAAFAGYVPATWLLKFYCIPAGILFINHARTLAAHHYDNDAGLPTDRVGQLSDSINLTGSSLLTRLAAPVGLRYHALHHLLPALPYHSLGAVHRTLEHELPAESPYRLTARRGILASVRELAASARRHAAAGARRSVLGTYTSRTT
jgi:fatty acid desaturase